MCIFVANVDRHEMMRARVVPFSGSSYMYVGASQYIYTYLHEYIGTCSRLVICTCVCVCMHVYVYHSARQTDIVESVGIIWKSGTRMCVCMYVLVLRDPSGLADHLLPHVTEKETCD